VAWKGRALQSKDLTQALPAHPNLWPEDVDLDEPYSAREAARRKALKSAERAADQQAEYARRWQEGIARRSRIVHMPGGDSRVEPADLRERSGYYGL
jgi:hypothetical protein